MEQYRSGHNGHDWKSCVPQKGTEGSNPSCSARKTAVQMSRVAKDGYVLLGTLSIVKGKRIERSCDLSLVSCLFSVYSGTFDYLTAFEYNYGRKSKEVTIWTNL